MPPMRTLCGPTPGRNTGEIPRTYCFRLMTPETFHRVGQPAMPRARMRDVLEWQEFDVELAAGASGLDRLIRVPHATELEDPQQFLRGGELIMTVGSELTDAASCERFVANLMRSSVAGLALAVGVRGHQPPPWLAPAAERAGLAVITVPPSVPFVQFTEKFQQLADERQDYERRRREVGRILDYIRRGFASAQVFREEFPEDPQARFRALCLPQDAVAEIGGVVLEGWIDEMTVVVAEDVYLHDVAESEGLQVCGLGSAVTPQNLARTLKEGIAALALSARRGEAAGPRDLSTLNGLLERLSPEQFRPFSDHIIRPLLQYDAKHDRALWATLSAYVESGASVAATAASLGIHANSVRNRLARISELTGLDPHSLEDQLSLVLAVRGSSSLGPDGRSRP